MYTNLTLLVSQMGTKWEAVFFSHRNIYPSHSLPELIDNEPSIPWRNSDWAKYLGVIFDRKLTWAKQITSLRNKANGAYHSLKPFFINKSVSQQTKTRVLEKHMYLCYPSLGRTFTRPVGQITRNEQTNMRILRGSLAYPWFVRNTQILQEIGLSTIQEAAAKYVAKPSW